MNEYKIKRKKDKVNKKVKIATRSAVSRARAALAKK